MVHTSGEQPLSLNEATRARKRTKAVEAWLEVTTTPTDPDIDYALAALQADEDSLNSEKSGLLSLAAVSVALATILATLYQQQQELPPDEWSALGMWYWLLFIASLFIGGYCTSALSWVSWRGRGRTKAMLRLLARRRDNARLRLELAAEAKVEAETERQGRVDESSVRAWRFVRVRGRTRQGQVYLATER